MKKSQNNHLTMQLSSRMVLNENETKFETFTAYPDLKEAIDEGITAEQTLASNQETRLRNSSAAKNQSKDAACEYAIDLSRKVKAFAVVKGNKTLLDQVKYTISKLKRTPDNKLVRILESVLAIAAENIEGIEEYGVTQQFLTRGNALLESLKSEIENFLICKAEQKQFTAQLGKQIKSTNLLFRTLDAMVETMRLSDPAFYMLYRNARTIKKSSNSKISAIGKAIDAETGLPLPNATISIQLADNAKSLTSGADLVKNVKRTSSLGGFQFKSLATGTYIVTVSYAGYADQQVIVHINEGVLSRFEIPLTKIQPEVLN